MPNIKLNVKILVVDDELEIIDLVKDYLEEEGYSVITAENGMEAVEAFRTHKPQLVILDIMLPHLDGMEVCGVIRAESSVPIIMLSARKTDIDKILGLGLGADDYVIKPFSHSELVARVKAQLRRFNMSTVPAERSPVLVFGNLEIFVKAYEVKLNGIFIDLSTKTFEILRFLAENPNQVFTREQIFENVWGYGEFRDLNTVTVHIKKIREKIETDPSNPFFIKTVWGIGYKFGGMK